MWGFDRMIGELLLAEAEAGVSFGAVIIFISGALISTCLGGQLVGWLLEPLTVELKKAVALQEESPLARGFEKGGAYIGIAERFLIHLFVFSGQPGAVGFLVAAKSIFRFGELSDHQNRLEAEYITIGTLVSFSWGLSVSLLTKFLIDMLGN